MSKFAFLLLAIIAFTSVAVVFAQDITTVAPVQVEVTTNDRAYSYDCWPVGDRRFVTPQPDNGGVEMMVWLTYPTGIAGYRCELVGQAVIIPMPRGSMKMVARDVRRVDGGHVR